MSIAVLNNNYSLGRGEAYFAAFLAGTQNPGGEAFFGDCSGVSATIKATTLEHYQSTGGVKQVDGSATVQSDSTGQLMTENITAANLALFFFGAQSTITQSAATVTGEVLALGIGVNAGFYYQLGQSANDPAGARGLDPATPIVVKDHTDTTTYTLHTDYEIDYVTGRLYIVPGTIIPAAAVIHVTYHTLAASRSRVLSGNTPIEGALRFLSANASGDDKDWYLPRVRLTPNGSVDLVGDKFATLTFDLTLLKKGNLPLLFIDGRPV